MASGMTLAQAMSLKPSVAVQAAAEAAGTTGSAALNGGSGLNQTPDVHTPAEMQKVAKQFEAIFLRMMLKEMRSTVEKNALTGNSRALDMFESMQDDAFADKMSTQGIGLSDMVYSQLTAAAVKNQRTTGS